MSQDARVVGDNGATRLALKDSRFRVVKVGAHNACRCCVRDVGRLALATAWSAATAAPAERRLREHSIELGRCRL